MTGCPMILTDITADLYSFDHFAYVYSGLSVGTIRRCPRIGSPGGPGGSGSAEALGLELIRKMYTMRSAREITASNRTDMTENSENEVLGA